MTTKLDIDKVLTTAKANWEVSKLPLFGPDKQPTSGYGIFRSDSGDCIGVVGNKYTPVQNRILLENLQESAEHHNVSIKRAGILDRGRKVFFQIDLPDVEIGKSNTMRYITALNSHDSSTNLGFGSTNVVVICGNTFYQAFNDLKKIRHSAGIHIKFKDLVDKMKAALTTEEQMIDTLIELSQTTISPDISDDFLLSIIGGNPTSGVSRARLSALKSANVKEFETHGETAYALFNGVTRFTNHCMTYKDVEAKKLSLIQGVASEINQRGLQRISSEYLKAPRLLVAMP